MRSARSLTVLAALVAAVSMASAQAPRIISFQGLLADAAGLPVTDGTHSLVLKIYDAATGGTALHTETQSVTVLRGVFNTNIGSATPIAGTIAFDAQYYLGVSVDGGAELVPRTVLASVPYSLHATRAASAAIADVADVAGALQPGAPGVVTSINTQSGAVTIEGTGGTTVERTGSVITIGSALGGGLTLPFAGLISNASDAFAITNTGTGNAGSFTIQHGVSAASAVSATTLGLGSAILGRIGVGTGGTLSSQAAIRGEASAGTGVAGLSNTGMGLYAYSQTGSGLFATSTTRAISALAQGVSTSYGVHAQSTAPGGIGVYGIASQSGTVTTGVSGEVSSTASGTGPSVGASGVLGNASASSSGAWSAGVRGLNAGGTTQSNGVIGVAAAAGRGVYGESSTGVGVYGRTTQGNSIMANTAGTANSLWVQHDGNGASTTGIPASTTNNLAVFNANGTNVARIDRTGKAFFNGGSQTGGADIAEAFDVLGDRATYSPGDVLVISTTAPRMMEQSSMPYSTLVAGVYATKPGVILTERNVDADHSDRVPMGVVGVLPTKVTNENGPIRIGDLVVTSSTAGHAMRGDVATIRENPGCVLGKALENFENGEAGVILILVSVK